MPTKNRKGNILSSLFNFFIGTIEILNRFEIGLFQMAKLFRQKHVKQAIIIASAFLLLLTTFEWVPAKEQGFSATRFKTEVKHTFKTNVATEYSKATLTPHLYFQLFPSPPQRLRISFFKNSYLPNPVKRFLFIRSILI
ncbi:MAG: hypothetical protein ACTHK8_03480 [Ginsengibacter sp.]